MIKRHLLICFISQLIIGIVFFYALPAHVHGLNYNLVNSEITNYFLKIIEKIPRAMILFFIYSLIIKTFFVAIISAPLIAAYAFKKRPSFFLHMLLVSLSSLLSIYCLMLIEPSLFITLISLSSRFLDENFLLLPYGAFFLAVVILYFIFLLRKFYSKKMLGLLLFLIFVPYALLISSQYTFSTHLNLKNDMTLVIVADSLRADNLEGPMPYLKSSIESHKYPVAKLVPVMDSTIPSMAAMLTGQMPYESQVSSAYLSPKDLTKNSVVMELRNLGYCTIGLGHYSGAGITRNNFGFEILTHGANDFFSKYLANFLMRRDPLLTSHLVSG